MTPMTTSSPAVSFELTPSEFTRAMHQAVDEAQVGAYFEMGACWELAQALHEALERRGVRASLVWRPTGFVHAWVQVGEHDLDHRGVFRAAPGATPVANYPAMEKLAKFEGGISRARYEEDLALARRVVDRTFVLLNA